MPSVSGALLFRGQEGVEKVSKSLARRRALSLAGVELFLSLQMCFDAQAVFAVITHRGPLQWAQLLQGLVIRIAGNSTCWDGADISHEFHASAARATYLFLQASSSVCD